MMTFKFPAASALVASLAVLMLAVPCSAQQQTAPAAQPAPVTRAQPAAAAQPQAAQPVAAVPTAPVAAPQAQAAPTPAAAPAPAPAALDASPAAPAGGDGKVLKSTSTGLHELSPWNMFMNADIIVKAVMLGLAFASLVTWTVFIAKTIELTVAQSKLRGALAKIAESRSLAEAQFALGAKGTVLSAFIAAAMREGRLSAGISSDSGIKERAASSFAEIVRAEARKIRVGMGLLASIGATSPFVGLFGTVWGIMSSFQSIAASKNTSLAVVAPGIAEALFATAVGLIAAIPATIFYNKFTSEVNRQAQRLEGFADEFSAILSRQIDERG